jgi:hypothetical protein
LGTKEFELHKGFLLEQATSVPSKTATEGTEELTKTTGK